MAMRVLSRPHRFKCIVRPTTENIAAMTQPDIMPLCSCKELQSYRIGCVPGQGAFSHTYPAMDIRTSIMIVSKADIFGERDRRNLVRLSALIRATEGTDELYMGKKEKV